MIASLFLDHGVSPNLPDRRGLPLILHSGTATVRQLLLDAGACVPAWVRCRGLGGGLPGR